MIVLSFSVCLLLFVLIGLLSARVSRSTTKDYLIAGRSVKPWLVALSAVSTNNSGYMFIGQIGYTFMQGISSIWLMIGWVTGDFVMSFVVHRRLREVSGQRDLLSFGGLIARWWGDDFQKIRFLTGLITILFLGTYAAAQFKAGGKALNVLFGWDSSLGIVIGAIMVVLYCFAGGIRASIWTDAAQSFVMLGSMMMLFLYAVSDAGGWELFWTKVSHVNTSYANIFPYDLPLEGAGPFLFVVGWLFAGFGVVGQPHIMVRMMTMDSPKSIGRFRIYYYGWYVTFYLLAIGVGLASRILLPDVSGFDPELALPQLSQALLPSVLVGLILAGIFAATMSTADSQILSCSACLTRDLLPRLADSYLLTKGGTILIALLALVIALFGGQNVFQLVLISWSSLGAAFTPILVLYCLGWRISEWTLIAMVGVGIGGTLIWRQMGWSSSIYEIAPGIMAAFLVFFVSLTLGYSRKSGQN